MSAIPTPYTRQSTFTSFQTPDAPTVGTDLEAEFNKVDQALDATQDRLAEIQRDDGQLKNLSVHPNALSAAVRALFAAEAGVVRGDWAASTAYAVKDVANSGGITYLAVTAHTSSSDFAVDLALGYWLPISGEAGATSFTPAADTAVVRTVQDKLRETVSVMDFGAVADYDPEGASANGTDNTAAFNAAFEYVRDSFAQIDEDMVSVALVIPPGYYRVGSVDFTDLRARNIHIVGYGAVLFGCEAGKAVVDCLNSRWLQVHGLTIYGDPANPPLVGLQIGRGTVTTNGNNYLDNVTVVGTFDRAAVHNVSSETTAFHKCRICNDNTDPAAYALIQDGRVHFLPESDYLTVTITTGTNSSFTNNAFYSCDIRNNGGGSAIFMAQCNGHVFDRGCYIVSFNDANVVFYQTSGTRCIDITFDGHFESAQTDFPTPGNTGVKVCFRFIGDATASYIRGLRVKSHAPHCVDSVFEFATGAAFNIYNGDIELQSLQDVAAVFFDGADVATAEFHGRLLTRAGAQVNAGDLAAFNGALFLDDFTTIGSVPVAGGFIAYSTDTDALYFGGGTMRNWGLGAATGVVWQAAGSGANIIASLRGKGTGNVRLGNDTLISAFLVIAGAGAVNGLSATATATGIDPLLSAQGDDADMDLRVRGKGTGGVDLEDGGGNKKVTTSTTGVGFQGTAPLAKPTVTGSRGGNAALASLLTALASYGLITDSSS